MSAYYTALDISGNEQFFHKEFSPSQVLDTVEYLWKHGTICCMAFKAYEDNSNFDNHILVIATMHGQNHMYRFFNSNVHAIRRMHRKIEKICFGI
jgi:hydroxymethylpyrimidine pyrophosphatase-like HAD family hydrolase